MTVGNCDKGLYMLQQAFVVFLCRWENMLEQTRCTCGWVVVWCHIFGGLHGTVGGHKEMKATAASAVNMPRAPMRPWVSD
jgi:hypothetical protein